MLLLVDGMQEKAVHVVAFFVDSIVPAVNFVKR
jgi:hypothetical protein